MARAYRSALERPPPADHAEQMGMPWAPRVSSSPPPAIAAGEGHDPPP
jgi:hypothetical protein